METVEKKPLFSRNWIIAFVIIALFVLAAIVIPISVLLTKNKVKDCQMVRNIKMERSICDIDHSAHDYCSPTRGNATVAERKKKIDSKGCTGRESTVIKKTEAAKETVQVPNNTCSQDMCTWGILGKNDTQDSETSKKADKNQAGAGVSDPTVLGERGSQQGDGSQAGGRYADGDRYSVDRQSENAANGRDSKLSTVPDKRCDEMNPTLVHIDSLADLSILENIYGGRLCFRKCNSNFFKVFPDKEAMLRKNLLKMITGVKRASLDNNNIRNAKVKIVTEFLSERRSFTTQGIRGVEYYGFIKNTSDILSSDKKLDAKVKELKQYYESPVVNLHPLEMKKLCTSDLHNFTFVLFDEKSNVYYPAPQENKEGFVVRMLNSDRETYVQYQKLVLVSEDRKLGSYTIHENWSNFSAIVEHIISCAPKDETTPETTPDPSAEAKC